MVNGYSLARLFSVYLRFIIEKRALNHRGEALLKNHDMN